MARVVWVVRKAEGGMKKHLEQLLVGLRGEHAISILGPTKVGDAPWFPLDIPDGVRFLKDFAVSLRFRRFLGHHRPEVIHFHGLKAALIGGVVTRVGGFKKVVFTAHNSLPSSLPKGYSLALRQVLKSIPCIISVSDALRTELLDILPENKVRTIPNGVDPPLYSCQDRRKARIMQGVPFDEWVVGTVARLIPSKGLHTLLESFSLVCNVIERIHLVLAGEGSERRTLERYADRLGIARRVHFLGYREDVATFMGSWDGFVLPTLSEGFSLALLEAMAAKLPVIATSIPSIKEAVIPGKGGLLVPTHDAPALAAAMIFLLKDPIKAKAMGEFNYSRVSERFSLDKMVESTRALYASL